MLLPLVAIPRPRRPDDERFAPEPSVDTAAPIVAFDPPSDDAECRTLVPVAFTITADSESSGVGAAWV